MAVLSRSVVWCLVLIWSAASVVVWGAPAYETQGGSFIKLPDDLAKSHAALLASNSVPVVPRRRAPPVFDSISLPRGDKEALDSIEKCAPFLWYPNGTRMPIDMAQYYQNEPGCSLDRNLHGIFDMEKNALVMSLIQSKVEDLSICHSLVELLSVVDAFGLTTKLCESRVLESVPPQEFCSGQVYKDAAILATDLGDDYPHLRAVADLLTKMYKDDGLCQNVCGGFIDSVLCQTFVDVGTFFVAEFGQLSAAEKHIVMTDPEDPKTVAKSEASLIDPDQQQQQQTQQQPQQQTQQQPQQQTQQQQPQTQIELLQQELLLLKQQQQSDGAAAVAGSEKAMPNVDTVEQQPPTTRAGAPSQQDVSVSNALTGGAGMSDTSKLESVIAEVLKTQGYSDEEIKMVEDHPELFDELLNANKPDPQAPDPQAPDPQLPDPQAPGGLPSDVQTAVHDQDAPLFPVDKKPDDDEENYESDDGQDKEARTEEEEEEGAVNELLAEAEEEVMEELEAEESLGLLSREEEQILDELEEKELEGKLGDGELVAELEAKEEEGVISEAEEEILEEIERAEEEIADAALYEADGIEGFAGGDQFPLMVDDAPEDSGHTGGGVLLDAPPMVKGEGGHHSWHIFSIFLLILFVVVAGYLCSHNRKRLRESVSGYFSDSRKKGRRRTRDYKPLSMTEKM